MKLLAVWVGKSILLALRLIGRRGNALPGLIVEKLFPSFLPTTMARLPQGVVVVTGTNGKTTTTKMISTLLSGRYRVLTNDTGSNFVRGVITSTVDHARWTGAIPYDVGVFELDEAWAVRFVQLVPPRRALLLNVMRDQLDRFGEIDTTAELLGQVAARTTGHLVLNRDDERINALAGHTKAQVSWYGVAPELRRLFPTDEELYGGPVHVAEQQADVELLAVPGPDEPNLTLRIGQDIRVAALHAEGSHNAQNAAGAAALARTFGLSTEQIVGGLLRVQPAFGRGQGFTVDGSQVVLQLVKNPAGFRQNLRTLDDHRAAAVVITINDDYSDGRDVSWLWDVDFSALRTHAGRIVTAGTRAADMAVRLHYSDITIDGVEPDPAKAVREAITTVGPGGRVVIFATYTAMWELYPALKRIGDSA
jgi:UDP-N-acetylmuramyl tripeptide synthase